MGYQTIQDQPVKMSLVRRGKKPSQMSQALDAHGNSPAKTRKPAKIRGCRPRVATSFNGSKTPDFKYNSVWIGERVTVRSLDFYALCRTCYPVTALATKNIFLLIRYVILGFILNKAIKHFITLFLRRHTKKMGRTKFRGSAPIGIVE